MNLATLTASAIAGLTLAGAASAAVVYSEDFESATGTAGYSNFGPSPKTFAVSSYGEPGNEALLLNIDRSGQSGGWGAGQFGRFSLPSLGTSDPSQVSLTADVAALGLNNPNTGDITLTFRQRTAADPSVITFATDFKLFTAGDDFMSIGGLLSEGLNTSGTFMADSPITEFATFFSNGSFGQGAVTTLYLDNVELTVIPEPASAAAVGLGGLLLATRRRRAL